MNPALLLQWHYMIFLAPFGISASLLLLSAMRPGHHGGHGAHGHASLHGPAGAHLPASAHAHSHALPAASVPTGAHGHMAGQIAKQGAHTRLGARSRDDRSASPSGALLGLMGIGRAPLPMILEAFGLGWGFCGFWANQILLPGTMEPSLLRVLPSLGIALAGGFVGARITVEILARVLPQEETLVVSHEGLFGLTGRIAFPVSETGGRIHIYDEHGTLHDETCRIEPDRPPIAKGRHALVVDMTPQGLLIVEEVPDNVR